MFWCFFDDVCFRMLVYLLLQSVSISFLLNFNQINLLCFVIACSFHLCVIASVFDLWISKTTLSIFVKPCCANRTFSQTGMFTLMYTLGMI